MKLYELLHRMESAAGCTISMEPTSSTMINSPGLQVPPTMNLHNMDYCRYVKTLDGNRSCAENKHYTMRLAVYGRRICGSCPYGIWEVVQPVIFRGKLVAVLYFGGFSCPEKLPVLEGYNESLARIPPPVTEEKKKLLKEYALFAMNFILWELETLASKEQPEQQKQHTPDYYLQKVSNYIGNNFSRDISLEDAAEYCGLTSNYLSNLLKLKTGKTFRVLLAERRFLEAKASLKYSIDNVTEIAWKCGFRDSNYFSAAFHRHCGCTPREYRKRWHKLQ